MTLRHKITNVLIAALTALALSATTVSAQQSGSSSSQTLERAVLDIAFRQGDRRIDRGYMQNSRNLAEFNYLMQNYVMNSDIEVESVTIIGGASIEGSAELNRDLSDNRAERMVEILRQYAYVPKNKVHVDSRGVNWEDVLNMVSKDSRIPDKAAVIDILENAPESGRKAALQTLNGGKAYQYMYDKVFPYVRTGRMTVTFRLVPKAPQPAAASQVVHDTVFVARVDTVIHIHRDETNGSRNINQNIMNVNSDRMGRRRGRPSQDNGKPLPKLERADSLLRTPIVALRTNLLLPLMNAGFEIPLGNRFTFGADWYYPWMWRDSRHEYCFEFLGGTGELRYWFGYRHRSGSYNTKYRFLGHSVALLGGAGYWDFQRDWSGKQGEYGLAGIDYMYAMPIGKRYRAHLEFEIAFGGVIYQDRPYDVFHEGGLLMHRDGIYETSSWVGPVKAGVNLVVPIFKKQRVALDPSCSEPSQDIAETTVSNGAENEADAIEAARRAAEMQQIENGDNINVVRQYQESAGND